MFGHGQQYVAEGRVCKAEDFGVLVSPARIITRPDGTVVTLVMNVVYPELLQAERVHLAALAPLDDTDADSGRGSDDEDDARRTGWGDDGDDSARAHDYDD